MNYGIIFAGGAGVRMKSKGRPKQFLTVGGTPIIIHTLKVFENCGDIDGVSVACLESHIPFLEEMIDTYRLKKVKWIVKGGEYGQDSRYNALEAVIRDVGENDQDIALIHDGVRPVITERLLTENIACVKKHGNAVTAVKSVETGVISEDQKSVSSILDRSKLFMAKAPQSYYLKEIYNIYQKAYEKGIKDSIDSCWLASEFGMKIHFVEGESANIKITTAQDFFILKALLDLKENEQIWGIE